MDTKQIEVRCPCCETRLTIDVLSRTVLRADAPARIDEETGKARVDVGRWDAARERVSGRKDSAQSKLDEALARERDKERRLDDLFDRARDKARRKPDEEE